MPQFDVTIAGELNLDLILYGLPEALELERELLADNYMLTLGGSSAIVAHNLAALGCKVGFVSVIGDDAMGQIALDRLVAGGVDISGVQRSRDGIRTGVTVVLQHAARRHMLTYMGTIPEIAFDDLDLKHLKAARHFHLSSFYLQMRLQPRIPELFGDLKAAGLTISMDTNDDPADVWQAGIFDALKLVDVFLPNEREATRITGKSNLEDALAQLAEIVPIVVVKVGAQGAVAQWGTKRLSSPALPLECVDAVGAGDSFNAGFLSEYVRGADLPTCLAMGNLAGAFSTTRAGGTEAFREPEHQKQFWKAHAQRLTSSSK